MEEQKAPSGEAPKPAPKSKALWIVIAVVVVVVVVLLAAVLGGLFGPPEDRVLKIGTVLTLTGTSGLEVFGPNNEKGVRLAVKEINNAGGVLGRPIELTTEDDQGVAATARDRAQKLVTTNHVDAIIGAVGSGFCAAVLEVTKPNHVVQVSASCTSPIFSNLTYTDGWFFRTAPSDALQGVVAANYAYTNRSFHHMVVFGNNNPYGSGLANVFATKFRALNTSNTATVKILAENQASYASDLQTAFTGTLPDAVYMAEYPTDGLKVMRDWSANSAWAGIQWVFSEGVLDQGGFVDKLPAQGINNATLRAFEGSAPGAYLGIVGTLYNSFLARFHTEYGATADPGLFSANAYDAVYLIAAAAQKAATATSDGIKANMRAVSGGVSGGTVVQGGEWSKILTELAAGRSINYEGASGAVNLNTFGDPLSGYGIWGIDTNNKIKTIAFFNEAAVIAMVGTPPAPFVSQLSQPSPKDIAVPARLKEA